MPKATNTPSAAAQSTISYRQINPLIDADGDTTRVRLALGVIANTLFDEDLVGKKGHDDYFGLAVLIETCLAALEYMPSVDSEKGAA